MLSDREQNSRGANGVFMENSSRRKFLITCIGGILTAAAGAVLYPVYRYLSPRKGEVAEGKVTIPESQVPTGEAKFFAFRGETGVVVHKKDGGYIALSAVCTHLGCIVQWQVDKQDFLCPCHGGRYTEEGVVISGPPPRPLPKLAFSIANGTITVG
jgi:cytochrome b6-f complex iron-sulfur subunit